MSEPRQYPRTVDLPGGRTQPPGSQRERPTHSAAPWSLNESDDLRYYGDGYICELYGVTEADKRLILKAPDLLAACRAHVLRHEAGMGEVDREATHDSMKALVDYIDGTGET